MDKIYEIIYSSLEEINRLRPSSQKIPARDDIFLYGSKRSLDSLEFVSLMVSVEQKLEKEHNIMIDLTGKALKSAENNPFETINSLHKYISEISDSRGSD
jgi:acyl carrier protein